MKKSFYVGMVVIAMSMFVFLLYGCSKKVINTDTTTDTSAPEKEKAEKIDEEMNMLHEELKEIESEDYKKEQLLSKIMELQVKKSTTDSYHPEKEKKLLDADVFYYDEPAKVRRSFAGTVKAASHDDNEEFAFYQDFCKEKRVDAIPYPWDISERYVIRVMQGDSVSGFNKKVIIRDKKGKAVFNARSQASGEIVLFPKMDLGAEYKSIEDFTIETEESKPEKIVKSLDDRINVMLNDQGRETGNMCLQICFLLDATGSMKDEIEQLQDVIFSIHSRILTMPTRPAVKFSIVAYRDKADAFLVKGRPFTTSIDTFQVALDKISAGGGGDYPEDIESAFIYCLDSLSWDEQSVKFVFLIGDAPPHLQKKEKNYLWAAQRCRSRGIMVCPIGASGLKLDGEFVFRQIAVITNGEFVFLHYGEQGESEGSSSISDPGKVSHHTGSNYAARRLDDIVVDIVSNELGFLTPEKMLIRSFPKPLQQADMLENRLSSLLRQVIRDKQIAGKTVALSPLSVSDSSLSQLSEYLWELAVEKLPELTKASIVERKRLEEIFKEQALDLTGATADVDGKKIGKLLSTDYLLLSSLHYLGSLRVCHMRLVDCVTGNVVSAGRVKL